MNEGKKWRIISRVRHALGRRLKASFSKEKNIMMLQAKLIVTSQQEGCPGSEPEPFRASLAHSWSTGLGVSCPQRSWTQTNFGHTCILLGVCDRLGEDPVKVGREDWNNFPSKSAATLGALGELIVQFGFILDLNRFLCMSGEKHKQETAARTYFIFLFQFH